VGGAGRDGIFVLTFLTLILVTVVGAYRMVWLVLAMFTAGVHLWPTRRRLGYGLARTFLANPGAPSWGAFNDRVT
jgi:hypothetical protein